ncbi:epsin-3 isoform X2 [Oryzias melastigma]|uniref:epsin-3 isoform X2 n=1 Tax=Oryzias melastigma TaxID=30732 RepID=UPI000CF827C8|nr:epsin-3 isoform X2 [Oryzias melastigma]
MQTSSIRRQMKNMVNNYTDAEKKVREATSNDPWGPSVPLMTEISDLTFNVVAFTDVMGIIWKRLNDHGKNWRHVHKALTLLEHLVKTGSERVVKACKDNIHTIQTLKDFQYIDRDGHDQGATVREKAKRLVSLLKDEEKLKKERSHSLKAKSRLAGLSCPLDAPLPSPTFNSDLPPSYPSLPSRLPPDLEQALPTSTVEEERQLQLAIALSQQDSKKHPPAVQMDEQTQLEMALTLSQKDANKSVQRPPASQPVQRAPQVSPDLDEDTQLQLAMSLSKEEHQQEQLSRREDELRLQKALEESKRDLESKGGSAFMDLVDVFGQPADPPPSDYKWKNTSQAGASARGGVLWDALDGPSDPRPDSPWMAPPPSYSPPPPWEPPSKPWETPQSSVSKPSISSKSWDMPANPASPLDAKVRKGSVKEHRPRSASPSDGDLFDKAMDGGDFGVNDRGEGSPELFDLSRLGESLGDPAPRKCHTPEQFLGPSAAPLVDLDNLIPPNSTAMLSNPFLPAPANNPFQAEPPKLSLNQMGIGSTPAAPTAPSLSYSASLPLPLSDQGPLMPSSFTHPTQASPFMPRTLPEPLLPFSSPNPQGPQAAQSTQNPFLD